VKWTQLEPDEGLLSFGFLPFELHVTIIRGSAVAWWCDARGWPVLAATTGEA
jgi:hypothetical protein